MRIYKHSKILTTKNGLIDDIFLQKILIFSKNNCFCLTNVYEITISYTRDLQKGVKLLN